MNPNHRWAGTVFKRIRRKACLRNYPIDLVLKSKDGYCAIPPWRTDMLKFDIECRMRIND